MLGLPELPDEKQYEQLKMKHSKMIEKRINLEKQLALMEQEKFRRIKLKSNQIQQQNSPSSSTTYELCILAFFAVTYPC